ncbi:MAG TPA: multiheme c-type cytochrome [Tepidisphaeraceae bacterium]|nr:multiheme c-type cytochrome [Tepidisphaeraceae bacterium]
MFVKLLGEGLDNMSTAPASNPTTKPRPKYVRAIGPRLRVLLFVVFALTALLAANSAYLLGVTLLEWLRGAAYQNYFYQCMFLAHLALGLALLLPFIVFGIGHAWNAHNRPKRRAVRMGYALFAVCLVLLFSGLALVRFEPFVLKNPAMRSGVYWAHVITPLLVIWLYILHRLAGPRIKWRRGLGWALPMAAVIGAMVFLNSRDPRKWNVTGPRDGERYFLPSLARTATDNFIPARVLMNDQYCLECHKDNYKSWFHSAHHFSSFNNPAYLFSVRETRAVSLKRDGNVKAARWCAGCHDTVPFFSGAFDNPSYDDVHDPTSQSGLSCTTCHAITHINSTRGNADYTIEEPIQYPFTFSKNSFLRFINRQLIKAKPEFHKQTFLKPLHKTAEFCSTCHKVSIPGQLNHYKEFLRGQNHYDTYLLSGVSGHGARSFYYPDKAKTNCAACHMPTKPSDDFGAKYFDPQKPNVLMVHDHQFLGGNTGLPALLGDQATVRTEQAFLQGNVRVDLFGIKAGGTIDGAFAEIGPDLPALEPGKDYLLEAVVRTLTVGHPFTQGTVDSNEVWVDVKAVEGNPVAAVDSASPVAGRIIARNGGMGAFNSVDPWAFFINVYMLDRVGNRIDRRNPQDIFTPLYNHQIPPGAGRVIHYKLHVPEGQSKPLTVEVKVNYRKFDTTYMQYVFGKTYTNTLPITLMAGDRVTFPIDGAASQTRIVAPKSPIPEWQRWNDYGIGLLTEGDAGSEKGELAQAAQAFAQVEKLGRSEGPMNMARVYFKEGRLDEAWAALDRAAKFTPAPPRWTLAWLRGLVDKQNGNLERAVKELQSVVDDRYAELDGRNFDFSKDYEVLNELGLALFERAKTQRADAGAGKRLLEQARDRFEQVLAIDSENLTAHYTLWQIYDELGDARKAAEHRAAHQIYRPDDNARDHAVIEARRRDKAADHAAQSVAIYDLQRPGAPDVPKASENQESRE